MQQCLDADDIDGILGSINPANISAYTFFEARTSADGSKHQGELINQINDKIDAHGHAIFAAHIRHHWVTAIVRRDEKGLKALILDSAPSPITAKDLRKQMTRLGITKMWFASHARQPYGSNQCGLHVILNIIRDVIDPEGTHNVESAAKTLDLGAWRTLFAGPRPQLRSIRDATRALQRCPETLKLLSPPETRGGGDVVEVESGSDDNEPAVFTGALNESELNVWKTGAFVSDALIDAWTDELTALPEASTWFLIPCGQMGLFCQTKLKRVLPKRPASVAKAAVILHLQHRAHFILVSWDGTSLQIRDSLGQKRVDKQTLAKIRLFWEVINDTKAPMPPVQVVAVERQKENECGIMAFNNLVQIVTGIRGTMSRKKIEEAWKTRKKDDDAKVVFEILPPSALHTKKNATREIMEALPTAPQSANDTSATQKDKQHQAPKKCMKCKRDEIANGLCAWHHPSICTRDRQQCTAKSTSSGKKCGEMAVGLCGTSTCWYHTLEAKRRTIIRWMEDPTAVQTYSHQPYNAVGSTQTKPEKQIAPSMTHQQVRNRMRTAPVGSHLVVKWRRPDERATEVVVRVVQQPSSTQAGKVIVLNNRCNNCRQWNGESDVTTTMIPETFTHYEAIEDTAEDAAHEADCCCSVGSDDEAECEEEQADANEIEQLRKSARDDADRQRATLIALPSAPDCVTLDSLLRDVFIYEDRPPHVHVAPWEKLTKATRRLHSNWLLRAKAAPLDIRKLPIGTAVVELVFRLANERNWSWPTISTNLSAFVTAIHKLPMYSLATQGVNLRQNTYVQDTLAQAQRRARIGALNPRKSEAMTEASFHRVAREIEKTDAWYLLQLAWHLAGRVGDVRRLQPKNVTLTPGSDGMWNLAALFVEGKGALWFGPYTIHTKLQETIAKPVLEYLRAREQNAHAFNEATQQTLSKCIGALPGHSLRSIRRGSLNHLSLTHGVSDRALQLLSGHKRVETLHRYLGWGMTSADAKAAADEVGKARAKVTSPKGGSEQTTRHPMWMGQHSGRQGRKGQRIQKPIKLFDKKTPSARDLGIGTREDSSNWPLHCKEVQTVFRELLVAQVQDDELRAQLTRAAEFLDSDRHYGITWAPISTKQIPSAAFTAQHVQRMYDCGKLMPLDPNSKVRCAAKGYRIPEPRKQRERPVFEPLNNAVINRQALPALAYPSRRERRLAIAGKRFMAQFDFAAWYDQIALSPDVIDCFVIRTREGIEVSGTHFDTFGLTREPMGSSHSAHVAQNLTWALLEPVLRMPGVTVLTMLDNVLIATDDERKFVDAVDTFVARCRKFQATLNDAETIPTRPKAIAEWGRKNAEEMTFLGEVHSDGCVRNTDANVEKLREAFERMQGAIGSNNVITKRNVAATISLAAFLADTLQISFRDHFEVLRTFSRNAEDPTAWDETVEVTPAMANNIGALVGPLLANKPVRTSTIRFPSTSNCDYNIVIVVDASKTGFGAIVQIAGQVFTLRSGWRNLIQHSAWAEPIAAKEVLLWARQRAGGGTAIISDHFALAAGQRRPGSGNGGFSPAHPLNDFYSTLYAVDDDCQVFFIPGDRNPADAPSRFCRVGDSLTATRTNNVIIPALGQCQHPYLHPKERKWWQR